MNASPQQNAYLRTKVMTANPAELRLMLFDGAIKFAEQGRAGLAERDYEQAYNGITRCQDIVMELLNTLQPSQQPEICKNLAALYTFMYTRLVNATTEREPGMVDEVIELLRYERETWQMVLDRLVEENASAGSVDQVPNTSPAIGAPANGGTNGSNNGSNSQSPQPSRQDAGHLVGGSVSLQG